jgi:L-asparaginase/Glu-tRNA(Gln) amidotransferase subunit D
VITSIADSDVSTIETYLKQYYRGLTSSSSGATSTDATWFAEIDINTR